MKNQLFLLLLLFSKIIKNKQEWVEWRCLYSLVPIHSKDIIVLLEITFVHGPGHAAYWDIVLHV